MAAYSGKLHLWEQKGRDQIVKGSQWSNSQIDKGLSEGAVMCL